MGVNIELPKVSPQPHTRLAFEGLEFAKDRDRGDEYNDRVMRAFFQESQDIGDSLVLAQLAAEVGLPADEFSRALDSHDYASRVEKLLRHAQDEMGITGVPLFVIGDQTLMGLQSRDALVSAIEQAGIYFHHRP
jgi:predicted DsbA family dithiol-disulfide isomerase